MFFSGLIFKQLQDLKYDSSLHPYILIDSSIRDFERLGYDKTWLLETLASLNRRGVPTILLDNNDALCIFMISLFKKYSDEKNRTVIPVRTPVTTSDIILANYCTIPTIDIILAERLKEIYPIPRDLYNASTEDLQKIEGIGKKKSKIIYDFFNRF